MPECRDAKVGFLPATTVDDGIAFGIVYVATAPTPNSGRVAAVSIAGMHDVGIEVGDAMNLIFPGGIRAPSVAQLSAAIADSALKVAAETDR